MNTKPKLMEQSSSSLFSLTIDPITKAHLSETARWARFLAITGMVFIALGGVGVLYFGYIMSSMGNSLEEGYSGGRSAFFPGFGVGVAIFYIILLVIWFFPLMYLLRFSSRARRALHTNDQQALNDSFLNLKACFRYVGILTIIILAFYTLGIVFAIVGSAAFS
jgi:hypothetical protein